MLMPHPSVLRSLLERYTELAAADPSDALVRRQTEDTAYTLCVTTGTRDIAEALVAAHRQLGRVREMTTAA
ncbi:DUF5133 domain-containing protein [Streptomyces gamaensis]|uniref:DUF5133 domain-containing protein n=1 Tax=Streptomyces gamaensis TaxID=1763542 RepID=A0ABW0ZDY6_9ACTN